MIQFLIQSQGVDTTGAVNTTSGAGNISSVICGGADVLKVMRFAFKLLDILCIIVPIILILIISIDFGKSVIAKADDEMLKNFNMVIKRLLMCAAFFLLPVLINAAIGLLDNAGLDYARCAKIAKSNEDLSKYKVEYPDIDDKGSLSTKIPQAKISASINTKFPDEVVENLAAFIGSEAGANKEGFLAQLMTGSVFINNMFYKYSCAKIKKPEEITKDNMCTAFKCGSQYTSEYCNITFETKGFTEEQKSRLLTVAKLLLTQKFTIPYWVTGQGKMQNWGHSYAKWGVATTSSGCKINEYAEDGCSQVYAYSKLDPDIGQIKATAKDVYGNEVSTNFDDYVKKAETLSRKYIAK